MRTVRVRAEGNHAAHANVEYQIGLAVEELRTVNEGEVMYFVHTFRRYVFVQDACTNCGDRVLAMQNALDPSGRNIYQCLRCNTKQMPASTQQVK